MKLSIVTVNLNNKEGLLKTLNSVFNMQSFIDFESIVIDGNSSDGSLDVIDKYIDKIAYWCSEPDTGIYNAMNKGITHSIGDYILFLNSGDCLVPNILERVFNCSYVEDFLYGNCFQIYLDKKVECRMSPKLSFYNFYAGSLIHSATFIKRDQFSKYLYSEKYKIVSDWEFFLKKIVIENASVKYLDLFISDFEMNGISSMDKYRKIQNIERMDVLSTVFPERILVDYSKFSTVEALRNEETLNFILDLNVSSTFKCFMIKCLYVMCKIYNLMK